MIMIPPRSTGHLPLHEAASRGDTAKIKELIAQGLDVNSNDDAGATAVLRAAANSQSNTIRLLASASADLDKPNAQGMTPLHKAAENGHTRAIIALADSKANVFLRNYQGETALHMAARNNHGDAARKLLQLGSVPETKDNAGRDVWTVAKMCHAAAVLEELKRYAATGSLWGKIKSLFGRH
jgi:uncharacterized protein